MSQDQRKHHRFTTWLPVRLEATGTEARLGVTHNVSESGVLLVSNASLSAGDPVTIRYRITPLESSESYAIGKIVRVDRNDDDPNGLWPYRVAVQFEAPLEGLEESFAPTTLA